MHRGKGIAAAALAALVLLLLTWGSGSGTTVLSAPSGEVGDSTPTRVIPTGDTEVITSAPEELVEQVAPALDWLMIVFAVIALAIAVRFLQWLLRREWESEERPLDELGDDLGRLLEATSEETRLAALAEGEPRNAVVRCWVALEDAASASGLDRDPAETAAEFTRRFLGVWDVDEASTRELADLYREARFSRHPVPRETGERAVELVASIHEQLRAGRERAEAERAEAEQAEAAETEAQGGGSR